MHSLFTFSGDRFGVRDCVWRATVSTNRHVFISYIISEQYYDGYGHKWIRQNTITIRTFWFHTVTFVGYSSYLVTIFPVGTQHWPGCTKPSQWNTFKHVVKLGHLQCFQTCDCTYLLTQTTFDFISTLPLPPTPHVLCFNLTCFRWLFALYA